MSATGDPLALIVGKAFQVPGDPQNQPVIGFTLANLSTLALILTIGTNELYLAPWEEATYEAEATTGPFPVVTPVALPGSPAGGTASLLVTYYWVGDTLPDTSQSNALVAAAIAAAIVGAVTVTGGTIDIGNSPTVEIGSGTVDIGNTPAVTVDSGTIDVASIPAVNIASGQVITVEPGADPIVTTGTVEVTSGDIVITGGQGGEILVGTASPPKALGTVTILAGQTTGSLAARPDANATGLLLICRPVGPEYTVEARGSITGISYAFAVLPAKAGANLTFGIPANNDNPISVEADTLGTPVGKNTDAVDVYELSGSGFQAVGNDPLSPLWVKGTQGSGQGSVMTVAAPPQLANAITNTTAWTELIPGTGGVSIRIRKVVFSTVDTTTVQGSLAFGDATGIVLYLYANAYHDGEIDLEGYALLPGYPLWISSNQAQYCVWTVTYDLY